MYDCTVCMLTAICIKYKKVNEQVKRTYKDEININFKLDGKTSFFKMYNLT